MKYVTNCLSKSLIVLSGSSVCRFLFVAQLTQCVTYLMVLLQADETLSSTVMGLIHHLSTIHECICESAVLFTVYHSVLWQQLESRFLCAYYLFVSENTDDKNSYWQIIYD